MKFGVLASGSGSNLQAMLDAWRAGRLAAEPAVVLSNVPTARALQRAADAGVPTEVVDHKAFADRASFETAMLEALARHGVELVCLAGFMRLLSPTFLRAYEGRILNIHPSLLPAFPGMNAQRQALEAGVRFAGCTVHFVDEGTDTGPILMQAVVPVKPDDDEASLSARILEQEHRIYPASIELVARGAVRLEGRRVIVTGALTPEGALINPRPNEG